MSAGGYCGDLHAMIPEPPSSPEERERALVSKMKDSVDAYGPDQQLQRILAKAQRHLATKPAWPPSNVADIDRHIVYRSYS